METSLFQTLTFGFPNSQDQLQFYLIPFIIAFFLLAFSLLILFKKRKKNLYYAFSLAAFSAKIGKNKLKLVEAQLRVVRFLCLLVLSFAFSAPALLTPENSSERMHRREFPPASGSALFLLLDGSLSMGETVKIEGSKMSKIDYLKEVSVDFIRQVDQGSPPQTKDLIGLMEFGRFAYVVVPPTFEHDILIEAIRKLKLLPGAEGEGSSLSYAVYKASHLFHFLQEKTRHDPNFKLKSSALILVTDGVETLNPADVNKPYVSISMDQAAKYAADNGIRLYLLIIFPGLRSSEWTPQRKNLEHAAQLTQGGLYILDRPEDLVPALQRIESLEKSLLGARKPAAVFQTIPLWPYFLWAGFILFLFYLYLVYFQYRTAP